MAARFFFRDGVTPTIGRADKMWQAALLQSGMAPNARYKRTGPYEEPAEQPLRHPARQELPGFMCNNAKQAARENKSHRQSCIDAENHEKPNRGQSRLLVSGDPTASNRTEPTGWSALEISVE